MFPATGEDGLAAVRCEVSLTPPAAAALCSAARPIVLAAKRASSRLSPNIAPGLAELGVFLPYSPLHHLLLRRFGRPIVATSGNISGEPVLANEEEVSRRLAHVADGFLHHNRRIVRPADDSVCRVIQGQARPLRIGRGAAPLELRLAEPQARPIVGLGGHMKSTVCLSWDNRAVVSPHIGEMDSPRSLAVFEQVVADLQTLYGVRAEAVVCDAHSEYTTSRWAWRCGMPATRVWHHYAHASALAGEHGLTKPMLVFTWDGVGLGPDGTLWGGEALFGRPGQWRRVATMRAFRLPGGERAGREPWRSAAGLCWEAGCDWSGPAEAMPIARQAWKRRVNAPETTAVGRLFDAAAAIVMNTHTVSYEGQGPTQLEALAVRGTGRVIDMPLTRDYQGLWRADWQPLLTHLLESGEAPEERAASVHMTLAGCVASQAELILSQTAFDTVGLCGGVFQNARLTTAVVSMLEDRGFDVRLGSRVPVNDAGLSFGQVVEYAAAQRA
jgi:hydrogenase maturation protein HypF